MSKSKPTMERFEGVDCRVYETVDCQWCNLSWYFCGTEGACRHPEMENVNVPFEGLSEKCPLRRYPLVFRLRKDAVGEMFDRIAGYAKVDGGEIPIKHDAEHAGVVVGRVMRDAKKLRDLDTVFHETPQRCIKCGISRPLASVSCKDSKGHVWNEQPTPRCLKCGITPVESEYTQTECSETGGHIWATPAPMKVWALKVHDSIPNKPNQTGFVVAAYDESEARRLVYAQVDWDQEVDRSLDPAIWVSPEYTSCEEIEAGETPRILLKEFKKG